MVPITSPAKHNPPVVANVESPATVPTNKSAPKSKGLPRFMAPTKSSLAHAKPPISYQDNRLANKSKTEPSCRPGTISHQGKLSFTSNPDECGESMLLTPTLKEARKELVLRTRVELESATQSFDTPTQHFDTSAQAIDVPGQEAANEAIVEVSPSHSKDSPASPISIRECEELEIKFIVGREKAADIKKKKKEKKKAKKKKRKAEALIVQALLSQTSSISTKPVNSEQNSDLNDTAQSPVNKSQAASQSMMFKNPSVELPEIFSKPKGDAKVSTVLEGLESLAALYQQLQEFLVALL